MTRRRQVTIRDVAAHAGVSHQTVSRVINGHERVTNKTRAKVEAAIQALGYRPNAIARSMARGRTGTLACLSPNLTDYTFANIIDGAEREARQHGFYLLSASTPDETAFKDLLDELITSRRVEGIMVINPYADERYIHLPSGFPTVFAGARPRMDAADSVALDDVNAAQKATEHLIELNHTVIGCITGPIAEDCTQDRCTGFSSALTKANLPFNAQLVVEGDWSAQSGYEAIMEMARGEVMPTAVFAQNDQMAVGALSAARELGLSVPDQLSIIGIDDIPLAAYFDPPLTTLRQDFAAIGREAIKLLIDAINEPNSGHHHLRLPAELIRRQSTKNLSE